MYVLAIDLGTSVCKVALLSARGEMLLLETEPVPLTLLPNGGAEQNPHQWWQIITQLVQRLLSASPVPVEQIRACAVPRNGPARWLLMNRASRWATPLSGWTRAAHPIFAN
jgi:sugar (pentulose or hexulose) kinase